MLRHMIVGLVSIGLAYTAYPQRGEKSSDQLDLIATFEGAMPTGVTVSQKGRVFVNFPRWGDDVTYTVAEIKDGHPIAYPDKQLSTFDPARPDATLVSVQSVVVDPADRLWMLDTGSVEFGPVIPGGAKLVGVDLTSDRSFKTIMFPPEVVLATTYLNDVRFDLRKGTAGVAYITDSSGEGPNGIIVVDLNSGRSRRRLHNHPSTKAAKDFLPTVEGKPLMERKPGQSPKHLALGSDGIAISNDGRHLYYCPLASRRLYRVPTDALTNEQASDTDVGKAVEDLGERTFASDGLESDAAGQLYLTDYEHNAIQRRTVDGDYEILVQDARLLWPDTLALGANGYLYITANQLHRQARFHDGNDQRSKPYSLFRFKVDGKPVLLKNK